ncbi:hypothetical protein DB346_24360 [Verrucomicrobia bacterium LW23]|nr:hypothetical protein DB346_24360 [Verrucomicrobia bacterium LW23]
MATRNSRSSTSASNLRAFSASSLPLAPTAPRALSPCARINSRQSAMDHEPFACGRGAPGSLRQLWIVRRVTPSNAARSTTFFAYAVLSVLPAARDSTRARSATVSGLPAFTFLMRLAKSASRIFSASSASSSFIVR